MHAKYLPVLAFAALLPACADHENAATASAVRTELSEAPGLSNTHIQVAAVGDVVYLNGLVDTTVERHQAESIARNTPGVGKVVNMLHIQGNN